MLGVRTSEMVEERKIDGGGDCEQFPCEDFKCGEKDISNLSAVTDLAPSLARKASPCIIIETVEIGGRRSGVADLETRMNSDSDGDDAEMTGGGCEVCINIKSFAFFCCVFSMISGALVSGLVAL